MKSLLLLITLYLFSSCVPSFHEGPDPHSIEFDKEKFDEVRKSINKNDKEVILKMKNIGFLSHTKFNNKYDLFYCGHGILDQPSWGFINGNFDSIGIKTPVSITDDTSFLELTYLEHLEDDWYRFSGRTGKRFFNEQNNSVENSEANDFSKYNPLPQSITFEAKVYDKNGEEFSVTILVVYAEKTGNEKPNGQIDYVKSQSKKIVYNVIKSYSYFEVFESRRFELEQELEKLLSNQFKEKLLNLSYVEVEDVNLPDSLYQEYLQKEK